jgi:hypothetical protein
MLKTTVMNLSKLYTTMKTGNIVRLIALLLLFTMITISCEDDTETDDPRDKITDSWKCQEKSAVFGETTYTVDITKSSSDSSMVLIDNFYQLGAGIKVKAKLNGLSLTIAKQTIDGNLITGSGSISSGYKTITWSYTVDDGGGKDNVTATYSKF